MEALFLGFCGEDGGGDGGYVHFFRSFPVFVYYWRPLSFDRDGTKAEGELVQNNFVCSSEPLPVSQKASNRTLLNIRV